MSDRDGKVAKPDNPQGIWPRDERLIPNTDFAIYAATRWQAIRWHIRRLLRIAS